MSPAPGVTRCAGLLDLVVDHDQRAELAGLAAALSDWIAGTTQRGRASRWLAICVTICVCVAVDVRIDVGIGVAVTIDLAFAASWATQPEGAYE